MKLLKEGDKLYTGKIVSKLFAEQYNFLSDYIQKKEEAGFDVENCLNAKHKFFVIYANLKNATNWILSDKGKDLLKIQL
jgi:hypothetical protein